MAHIHSKNTHTHTHTLMKHLESIYGNLTKWTTYFVGILVHFFSLSSLLFLFFSLSIHSFWFLILIISSRRYSNVFISFFFFHFPFSNSFHCYNTSVTQLQSMCVRVIVYDNFILKTLHYGYIKRKYDERYNVVCERIAWTMNDKSAFVLIET